MKLTTELQAILDGEKGEVLAKVAKTLVKYGEIFGAEEMVPVTSKYNHLVTSFGLKALGPVYELMNQLIESGNLSTQQFSCDPRPLDSNVPSIATATGTYCVVKYSLGSTFIAPITSISVGATCT